MSSIVPSPTVHGFWESFYKDLEEYLQEAAPDIAEIGAMASGSARITERGEAYDPASELLPVISLYPPKAGDAVLVTKMADGSEVVLGSIATGAEPDPISQAQADARYPLLGSYDIPQFGGDYAAGATTASTTSTSTYANAFGFTIATVPAATYSVLVIASGIFKHSAAGGQIDVRPQVDVSTDYPGTVKTINPNSAANGEMVLSVSEVITGIVRASAGFMTVRLQYKSNTAGTSSVRNVSVAGLVIRTA